MLRKALVARIERAEQTAQGQSISVPECVCFPPQERPFFGFPIEEQIAAQVRCTLHGQRFKPLHHLFVPKWRRESERKRWPLRSEQYQRAWLASFPPEPLASRRARGRKWADLSQAEGWNEVAILRAERT